MIDAKIISDRAQELLESMAKVLQEQNPVTKVPGWFAEVMPLTSEPVINAIAEAVNEEIGKVTTVFDSVEETTDYVALLEKRIAALESRLMNAEHPRLDGDPPILI